ncbi:MAG: T9SS type A sorting domain-containing protein [Crocinitomicaceae bacterium]|nr:T9SS type A sorting domain-containing protein [Flavobacteriales bacterium]NQZ37611.1 T9SS type A sorting domain-containing protein [Crocinitomicaceae bacterium]
MFKFKLISFTVFLLCNHSIAQMQNNGNLRMHANSEVGIFGDFTNNGMFSSNLGTVYACGSVLQTFDGTNFIQTNNLIMMNASGLQVDNEVQVSNQLLFSDGIIFSDRADIATEFIHFLNGSIYSGANDSRYVDGVIRKTGNTAFLFPVGDDMNLQTIRISPPLNTTDHFTTYYVENDPDPIYSTASFDPTCINNISRCEYWILNRTGGTSNIVVGVDYDVNSCGVSDMCELILARWNGVQWISEGNGGVTGSTASGTLSSGNGCGNCGTTANVTSFSPFTLSSADIINLLPIELISFQAKEVDNRRVDLTWQMASEMDNDYFEIHRSVDLDNWKFVTEVDGAGNSIELLNYTAEDLYPLTGLSYYRLTQVNFNGQSSFGEIRSVIINSENSGSNLSIYPNPTSGDLKITGLEHQLQNLRLFSSIGQRIKMNVLTSGSNNVTIDLSNLSSGIYFLKSNDRAYKIVKE